MDVTPQVLHDVEFREAKRGYNTQDVDEFLERLEVGLERQVAQIREARERAEVAEALAAEADRRVAEAQRAAASTAETDETLRRTLVIAQRTADAVVKEAEDQAATTISDAEKQALAMLEEAKGSAERARAEAETEARAAQESARAAVLAELRDLEAYRDELRRVVETLDSHLAVQRNRIRVAAGELQRLLDDPSALRVVLSPSSERGADVADPVRPAIIDGPTPDAPPPSPDGVEAAPSEPTPTDVSPVAPEASAESEAGPDDGPSDTITVVDTTAAPGDQPDIAPEAAGGDQVESAASTGAPTEAIDLLAERDAGDDAYLAELRKAMTDESPLGPRDDLPVVEQGELSRRFGRRG